MSQSRWGRFSAEFCWLVDVGCVLTTLILIGTPWLVPGWWRGPGWVPTVLGLVVLARVAVDFSLPLTALRGRTSKPLVAKEKSRIVLPSSDQITGRSVFMMLGLPAVGTTGVPSGELLLPPRGWSRGDQSFDVRVGSHESAKGEEASCVLINWYDPQTTMDKVLPELQALCSALRAQLEPKVPLHGVAVFITASDGDANSLRARLRCVLGHLATLRLSLGVQCPCYLVIRSTAPQGLNISKNGVVGELFLRKLLLPPIAATETLQVAQQKVGELFARFFLEDLPSSALYSIMMAETHQQATYGVEQAISQRLPDFTYFRHASYWRAIWPALREQFADVLLSLRQMSGRDEDAPYCCGCLLIDSKSQVSNFVNTEELQHVLDALVSTRHWADWTRQSREEAEQKASEATRQRRQVLRILIVLTILYVALLALAWWGSSLFRR